QELLKIGQFIPGCQGHDVKDLLQSATIETSSELVLSELYDDGPWFRLIYGAAQLLPVKKGPIPAISVDAKATEASTLTVSIRKSLKDYNYTPDIILGTQDYKLEQGKNVIEIDNNLNLEEDTYLFICFHKEPNLELRMSNLRISGIVSVFNKQNIPVSNYGRQDPDPSLGFEAFEFWVPIRRPDGHNISMKIKPGLRAFSVQNLRNGINRPYISTNAWVAALEDDQPTLKISWNNKQVIKKLIFSFDTDWDQAMESSLLGHAESVMAFVVRSYLIYAGDTLVFEKVDNYQTRNICRFKEPIETNEIKNNYKKSLPNVPVGLFGLSIYEED
ncbi:MAG: hypothetical protein KDC53_25265, partial [Saprospiraceae bacterium]|nr:hypothetical protein [Saprospiraceae bacterium]